MWKQLLSAKVFLNFQQTRRSTNLINVFQAHLIVQLLIIVVIHVCNSTK